MKSLSSISLTSAPAANARSEPVITTTADLGIGVVAVEGLVELADQLSVQGIERVRPVQGDQPDRPAALDQDGLVGHACSLPCSTRPRPERRPPRAGARRPERASRYTANRRSASSPDLAGTAGSPAAIQRWQRRHQKVARLAWTSFSIGRAHTGQGRPDPAIDREAVLEEAERAVGLNVVAKARAAGRDRLVQHAPDRRRQAPAFGRPEETRGPHAATGGPDGGSRRRRCCRPRPPGAGPSARS